MLLVAYLLMQRLLQWGGRGSTVAALELENAVLRHEVRLLRRGRRQLGLRRVDRAVLAAPSRVISRDRWSVFMVRPQTLLRWHRDLVRRKWTYKRRADSVVKGACAQRHLTGQLHRLGSDVEPAVF